MIGVFDSGFGGLNILKYFINSLPQYNYIYFGDSARAPYGSRAQDEIYNYTCQAIDFLFSKNCKLVIIACNSASSKALRKIQQEYLPKKYPGKKVLGVIVPVVEKISQDGNIKRAGVIGTEATISSNVYFWELNKLNPRLDIYQQPAPQLASLIEEEASSFDLKKTLVEHLTPLKEKKVDGLILGCTHYPILIKEIQRIMGEDCLIPHPGEIIADSLVKYLSNHPELEIKSIDNPCYKFYTTGKIDRFQKMGEKFLGQEIKNIEKINL